MKIIIEIPEKTNAHIRSDYGHGVKGLRDEDREIVLDAIYNGIHYEERPHGEWIRYTEEGFDYAKCSACKWDSGEAFEYAIDRFPFCPNCGADMREGESSDKTLDNR